MHQIPKKIAEQKVLKKKLSLKSITIKSICAFMAVGMLAATGIAVVAAEATSGAATRASYSTVSSKVNSTINTAKNRITQLYDLDTQLLQSYFDEVQAKLNQLKNASGDTTALEAEIDELCNKIVMASAESKVVSARGTWHRPSELSYNDIEKTVKTFSDCGMNIIFVETFYHGYTIYKSNDIEIPYYPTLSQSYTDTKKGIVYNDYLSAFIACCNEYDIEVHAWVENFYIGVNMSTPIVANHPDWVMYNDDGSITQRKEGGSYIFLDPANIEVQNTLIDFYNDLFEKNPGLSGLNLDYIRYPVSDSSYDTGYTIAAMTGFYESLGNSFNEEYLSDRDKMANQFQKLFNKDYLVGGQTAADQNYKLWVEYRTNIITNYVERVKNEVKQPNDILLSTAVFASISESVNSKKADWQKWYQSGWIDIATPMAYYSAASSVQTNVKNMISLGGDKCLYYTGLASSYSGYPAYYNKEFVEASYNAGAAGYVIFASQQIIGHEDVQLALGSGVGRKSAILPHADIGEILDASFDDILDKADRLYIPAGGMTASKKNSLKTAFDQILAMSYDTSAKIQAIYNSVNTIKKNLSSYASGYSYDRINGQLSELLSILNARYSMSLAEESEHIYTEVVTPPTCVDRGYTTHICTCGDVYVDSYVNALGHNLGSWSQTIAPTCENKGEEQRDCSRCNYYEKQEVDLVPHKYESKVISPSCTKQGYTSHVCTACDDSWNDNYTDALGHEMGEWNITKSPTCAEKGSAKSECIRCTYYKVKEVIPLGHNWLDATETSPKTCQTCGATEGDTLPLPDGDAPEAPGNSEIPGEPEVPTKPSLPEEEKLSFFEIIWQAILNFFRMLFGKK